MTCIERKNRYLDRKSKGLAVLDVEVDLTELTDALIEAQYLPEWDAHDRSKVEAALSRVVADLIKVTRSKLRKLIGV